MSFENNRSEGIGQSLELPKENLPELERITSEDLKPVLLDEDETMIALQCNARDKRDVNAPKEEMGKLEEKAAEQAELQAENFFNQFFGSLSPEEQKTVDIFVVAADTKLDTPIPGVKSESKRAVETAERIIAGAKKSLEKFKLSKDQIVSQTNKNGEPTEISKLVDLEMFKDSPEFVEFIKIHGTGKDFWIKFEEDAHKDTRLQMGAEGPADIADRVEKYLKVVTNAMESYHEHHPGRRAIFWAVTHYDTISPYVKLCIAGKKEEDPVYIDKGAGIVIKTDKEKNMTAKIQGKNYNADPSHYSRTPRKE